MTRTFTLQPHPATPCDFIDSIEVVAELTTQAVQCTWSVSGSVDRLVVPAPSPAPGRTDGLWQQTCFEVFLGEPEGNAYREFNFSPSGDWAAYRFSDYRDGMANLDLHQAPCISFEQGAERLRLIASLAIPGDSSRMALSVVLKDRDGSTYYWALHHAPGKPDFHHPSAFVR